MTEVEWLACDNVAPLLIYLRGEVSAQEQAESKGSLHGSAGRLFDGPSPLSPPHGSGGSSRLAWPGHDGFRSTKKTGLSSTTSPNTNP